MVHTEKGTSETYSNMVHSETYSNMVHFEAIVIWCI